MEPGNDPGIYNRAVLRSNTGDLEGAEADLSLIIDRYLILSALLPTLGIA